MTKKLLPLLFLSASCYAFVPVRYVQISTNTLSRQTGTEVVAAVDVSTLTVSSGTFQNIIISTLSWVAQPSSGTFAAERCAKELMYTITTSSSSAVNAFITTNLSGSITPHSTASYIKIQMSGSLQPPTGASAVLTILRSINGGAYSNILASNGGSLASPSATVNIQVPAGITYMDSPSTVNPITYAVGLNSFGTNSTFCASNETCTLRLQECF